MLKDNSSRNKKTAFHRTNWFANRLPQQTHVLNSSLRFAALWTACVTGPFVQYSCQCVCLPFFTTGHSNCKHRTERMQTSVKQSTKFLLYVLWV